MRVALSGSGGLQSFAQRKQDRASPTAPSRESPMRPEWLLAPSTIFLAVCSLAVAVAGPRQDDLDASVASMARIGVCYSASFPPDGTRLAFNSDLGGIPQVWTVAVEGGWPTPVTALDDPVHFLHWSPDGSAIAFTVAPGGGMNEQVYTVRPDGTGLRRLTEGGKETNRLGRWTHDGQALMLASNRKSAAEMDAYLVDAASGRMSLVAETRGIGGLTDVSRDGRRAILNRQVSRGDEDLFLVELPAGDEERLTPHGGPGSFANGRFSPDGRTVYLSSNAGRDLIAFARASHRFTVSTGSAPRCSCCMVPTTRTPRSPRPSSGGGLEAARGSRRVHPVRRRGPRVPKAEEPRALGSHDRPLVRRALEGEIGA